MTDQPTEESSIGEMGSLTFAAVFIESPERRKEERSSSYYHLDRKHFTPLARYICVQMYAIHLWEEVTTHISDSLHSADGRPGKEEEGKFYYLALFCFVPLNVFFFGRYRA